jgi:hypothetical protein
VKPGIAKVLFALLVIIFPVLHEVYGLLPEMEVRYYERSTNFFYLLFAALGFLFVLIAWRISVQRFAHRIYRIGYWVLFTYGVFQLYLVFPWSQDLGFGFTLVLAISTAPLAILFGWLMHSYFGKSKFEELEEILKLKEAELQAKRALIEKLEKEDLFKLQFSYTMLQTVLDKMDAEETNSWIETLKLKNVEIYEAIRSIDEASKARFNLHVQK